MKNITLDFTRLEMGENQELAIMPAGIAEMLLKNAVDQLKSASAFDICGAYRNKIDYILDNSDARDIIDDTMKEAYSFIQMRKLVNNLSAGNWDAYKVKAEHTE